MRAGLFKEQKGPRPASHLRQPKTEHWKISDKQRYVFGRVSRSTYKISTTSSPFLKKIKSDGISWVEITNERDDGAEESLALPTSDERVVRKDIGKMSSINSIFVFKFLFSINTVKIWTVE